MELVKIGVLDEACGGHDMERIWFAAWSPCGKYIASCGTYDYVRLWGGIPFLPVYVVCMTLEYFQNLRDKTVRIWAQPCDLKIDISGSAPATHPWRCVEVLSDMHARSVGAFACAPHSCAVTENASCS